MPRRIEDYALLGDMRTAALVAKDGSIDWLCLPRFDSEACFAAILGNRENGRWQIAPCDPAAAVRRAYRDGTMVLDTTFTTAEGEVTLTEFMPVTSHSGRVDLVRVVRGVRGSVAMSSDLVLRFAYGSNVPWVRRVDGGNSAIAGPHAVVIRTPVDLHGEDMSTVARFTVREGDAIPFTLTWYESHRTPPEPIDPHRALAATEEHWQRWAAKLHCSEQYRGPVGRSLNTLKALTYSPTGGIVAAPTMSLPEEIGGVRNWDYRYCWLRDATFTLYALLISGFTDEARAWRDWLLRSVAGMPSQLQIMYGVGGERLLPEFELPWLPGFEGSRPVRVGNAAHSQRQLDVYGELMDTLEAARREGLACDENAWALQRHIVDFVVGHWREPDHGLWEVRGPERHFTHSRLMAWVALDRAVKAVERAGLEGPVDAWRAERDAVRAEILERGFNPDLNAFVQSYGSRALDAATLMVPLVGFLPANDARVVGTLAAVERHLMADGFVRRYSPESGVDGVAGGEGAFLACSFWFADNLALMGRHEEATARFQRLLDIRNDVGLLAEEYDPVARRQLGNFPQAFSHVSLVNTAHNLAGTQPGRPAEQRARA